MADDSEKPTPVESKLERIAAILYRHQDEFLVIGGHSEILMGSPRVTYDTDLCYRRDPENLQRRLAATKFFDRAAPLVLGMICSQGSCEPIPL
jgi:hypothetical protein